MNKIITLLALSIFWCHNNIQAQGSSTSDLSRTVMKIHPQQFIDNTFFLSMEAFNKDFSNSVSIGLGLTSTNKEINEIGHKLEIQYRYYPLKFTQDKKGSYEKPFFSGIFAGVYLHHSYNVSKSTYFEYDEIFGPREFENERKVSALNPGVVLGYQKTFLEKLYVEVFVGGGVRSASITDSYSEFRDHKEGIFSESYKGVYPKIGLSLGIGL